MILLTTSRRPTRRIRTLCRDLVSSIPGLTRVNRGKMSLYEVGEKAAELEAEKIVIVDRWKGGAGRIRFLRLGRKGLTQVPPSLYVRGVKLQREFNVQKKRTRSLSINGTDGGEREVRRLRESLSNYFSAPVMGINQTPAEQRTTMRLSLDSSRLLRISFYTLPEDVEIGPRITVSHVAWEI